MDKQPEQEPVAWIDKFGNTTFNKERGITPLYTTPPQRKPKNLMQVKRISDQSIELVFTSCAAASEFENGIKE